MNRLTALPLLAALSLCISSLLTPASAWEEKPISEPAATGAAPAVTQPVAPPAPAATPETLKPKSPDILQVKKLKSEHYKRYGAIAGRMARDQWLDRAAAADPAILTAICAHSHSAFVLAQHPHLDRIADADHYLCRRITKWRGASWALVQNPHVDHVIALDPEGIYRAIRANPGLAYKLSRHPMFSQMIMDNPELGVVIARHM